MRILVTLLTMFLALSVVRGAEIPVITQADSAYSAENYPLAEKLYREAIKQHGTSASLFYNLGNAYYRQNRFGQAILNYERALKLDPSYGDARFNLSLANKKITDRPGERGSFLINVMDSASNALASNMWAWLALGCFLAAVAGGFLYFFSDTVIIRKIGFFGGFLLVIVSGIFIFFSYRSASASLSDDYAIVIKPSSILSTAPRVPKERSQEAMLVHEGTKVEIIDSVNAAPTDSLQVKWYNVRVDNDHQAWINGNDIEKI